MRHDLVPFEHTLCFSKIEDSITLIFSRKNPRCVFQRKFCNLIYAAVQLSEYGISSEYNMILLSGLLIFGDLLSLLGAEKSIEAGLSGKLIF